MVGRNASWAAAENRMLSVDTIERRAPRSGVALVARPGSFAEIFTPRLLQDVSAEARHVSDLLARCELQALRNDGIVALDLRIILRLRHAHECAQPQTPFGGFDPTPFAVGKAI